MAMTEEQRAALSKKRGQAAGYISDPDAKRDFIAAQGAAEAKKGGASDEEYQHLDREAEDTIATQGANRSAGAPSYAQGTPGVSVRDYAPQGMRGSHKVGAASFMPMYKDGTKKVPKTGLAKLHKGEVRVSHDAIKKAVAKPAPADRPGTPGSAASDVPMSLLDRIKAEAGRRIGHAANIPSDVGRAAMGALGGQPDEMQAGVAGAQADAGQAFGMPQYKKGVAKVPKTGPAVVHEGEAIIPKDEVDEAKKNGKVPPTIKKAVKNEKVRRDMSLLVPDEPKKKDIHITISRAKNGGYVAHHQHNSPHPDEMYHLPTREDMLMHMNHHMGEDEE